MQIINQDTLVERDVQTDATGAYSVPGLAAGRFQVIIDAERFTRRTSPVISLGVEPNIVFNAKLLVNSVKEEVEVTGTGETAVETGRHPSPWISAAPLGGPVYIPHL